MAGEEVARRLLRLVKPLVSKSYVRPTVLHQVKGLVANNKNLLIFISAVKLAFYQVAALRSSEIIEYKKRVKAFAGMVNVLICDTLIPKGGAEGTVRVQCNPLC